jgi:hypothetical protein
MTSHLVTPNDARSVHAMGPGLTVFAFTVNAGAGGRLNSSRMADQEPVRLASYPRISPRWPVRSNGDRRRAYLKRSAYGGNLQSVGRNARWIG